MNRPLRLFVTFCLAVLGPVAIASAHHAAASQYDVQKVVQFKGVLTKVEWVNPHVYLHIAVKDDKGAVANWAFETLGPGRMRAEGMSKQTFGIGKTVTLKGYAARDGSKNLGFLRQVTFDDGHSIEVWLGDPDDVNP